MSEIKISKWECEICGNIYDTKKEYKKCVANHEAEEVICIPGKSVTVGISRSGQSMMGGPIGFEGYDWTVGKIVAKRKSKEAYGPEALIEIDGERNWTSGYMLLEWDRQKKAEEHRAAHPSDYSNISSGTIIFDMPKGEN